LVDKEYLWGIQPFSGVLFKKVSQLKLETNGVAYKLWSVDVRVCHAFGAKLQATNHVPRPVDRGTATRYGG